MTAAPTMGKVTLVAFYNVKALGARYLEAALTKAGYSVQTIFFKDFNSVNPSKATERELQLFCEQIQSHSPNLIALSVMSSMYLDTVNAVLDKLGKKFDIPVVCGGAFASMFPEYFLDRDIDFVIRTDGEIPIRKLADSLVSGESFEDIPSLCYKKDGSNVINEIGDVINDIDEYGLPSIKCSDAMLIENNSIVPGDPQLNTLSYEVIASRGCPFTCSYCCCKNLRELLPKGVKGVRTRSVQSIMEELILAKKECKRLVFIHFYDEIFPNLPGWVDEFVVEYKKHINLPFTIWGHPKMIDAVTLKKLVSVGLVEVIMGIQSGSQELRKNVFNRHETQQDILNATKIIEDAGVFWASYDFMLQHPFESIDELKESYYLAKEFHGKFELQLHGLNFLPGTDIVSMAIDQEKISADEMEKIMYATMEEQFGSYWKRDTSTESQLWYSLIYLWQFKGFRNKCLEYEKDPLKYEKEIFADYEKARKKAKTRYLYKKARIAMKRVIKI